MWYDNTSYHSDAGPRRAFFVWNPVWKRNLETNCTVNNDNSSRTDDLKINNKTNYEENQKKKMKNRCNMS